MPEPTRDQLEVLLRRVRLSLGRPPTPSRDAMILILIDEIDQLLPPIWDPYRPLSNAEWFDRGVVIKEQPDD